MAEAFVIAVLGAESTGKTSLSQALVPRLATLTGLRCQVVGEHLREWCDRMGRTPRADEQAAIAQAQASAIEEAAARHDVVVCDTTPLMTAIYSEWIFGDTSLVAPAVHWHRRCAATLLTALDLPWVPDGLQRDGPHVQAPVDSLLRGHLAAHGLAWSVVGGAGEARVAAAINALTPLLRQHSAALALR